MPAAETQLRILIVEDNADDAALVLRELRKSGYEPAFERVDTAEAMRAALKGKPWDIILSDYVVPGFGGIKALRIAKESGLDLPFILVSGKKGEETAVEAMKAGAADFIMKDRLGRLGSVVKRELADAAARRGSRQAEIEWRAAFDSVRDAIFFHDVEHRVVRANRAYAELAHMAVRDVIGKRYWEVFPKRDGPLPGCRAVMEGRRERNDEEFTLPTGVAYSSRSFAILNERKEYHYSFHVLQDITERKQAEERSRATLEGTIRALSATVDQRDPYTAGHQLRVAQLAIAIGRELGFNEQRLAGVRIAGIIHDIGKISVPAEILVWPGQLSPTVFELIKPHAQVGYDIVKGIDFPWPVADAIRQHHERLDGSGYPQGLKGDQIILEARILAVADVVEAMCSHRPYRPAHGIDAALKEVEDKRGRCFDRHVVDACVRAFRDKGFTFEKN